jgi:hypothetical protein
LWFAFGIYVAPLGRVGVAIASCGAARFVAHDLFAPFADDDGGHCGSVISACNAR